jgi:hypothetical protein
MPECRAHRTPLLVLSLSIHNVHLTRKVIPVSGTPARAAIRTLQQLSLATPGSRSVECRSKRRTWSLAAAKLET